MTPPIANFMPRSLPSVRLFLVCLVALAVALPVAIVGVAKLLLFLGALAYIVKGWVHPTATVTRLPTSTPNVIMLALAVIATGSLWSTGSTDESLLALIKHGKLILIPILLYLIQSRREALIATAFFVGGQLFLLASTWLLFFGIPVPWVISNEAGICEICSFAVFSSYLDQSIMTAVLAGVCWQLRSFAPAHHKSLITLILSGLALTCVFFVFQGRTGHLIAVALITLAIVWELPSRFRIAALAVPFVLVFGLMLSSGKVNQRLLQIDRDVSAFERSGNTSTSSGDRLNLWYRSVDSISEHPWYGSGVGSWNSEFNRQEAVHALTPFVKVGGNPHQEYLLWGVELGVPGIALLLAIMVAVYCDSLRLQQPERRALQSVLLSLILACLFNCSLHDALIGDFFCVALALVLSLGIHATANTRVTSSTARDV